MQIMNNTSPEPEHLDDDMRPEYDFSDKKGVRGKYYHAYQQGYTIRIQQADGSVVEEPITSATNNTGITKGDQHADTA